MLQPTDKPNLALVGMMGSGKTTIGALLAQRVGWTFLDTDLMLEGAFRKPVERIFADGAEEAFRSAERLVVRLLASARETVIATGGGLWLAPDTRGRLAAFAWTAYLEVPAALLWERLKGPGLGQRPLLAVGQPYREVERLLAERESAYALADWRVDASGGTQEVVQQLLRRMKAAGLIARRGRAA